MSEVSPLGQVRLQDYSEIIGETEIGSLETLAEQIRGRSVVHVNATSYGGGVAEILHSMISLMRNMGLDAHWKVIKGAEREFKNAASCLESEDHSGSLKYLQECMEYAVKAVLIAYGIDYPKIHAVGRFLYEIEEKYPEWFLKQIPDIAGLTDSLARGRPRFRYPYEHPLEDFEAAAEEVLPKAEKALESCHKLIKQLFA